MVFASFAVFFVSQKIFIFERLTGKLPCLHFHGGDLPRFFGLFPEKQSALGKIGKRRGSGIQMRIRGVYEDQPGNGAFPLPYDKAECPTLLGQDFLVGEILELFGAEKPTF
jgi:hypothetical protein